MELSPAAASEQLSTEAVRVTRWDFPPGSETGVHRHEYDYVVVPVVPGTLTITTGDGQVSDVAIELGVAYERRAGVEHNVANLGDTPIAFVDIELLEHGG